MNYVISILLWYYSLTTVDVLSACYNPVPGQTDSTPLITADGSKIDLEKLQNNELRWIAVSQDFIKNGRLKYGDTVIIFHSAVPHMSGKWVVRDCMNKRYKKTIDFLTYSGNIYCDLWHRGTVKLIFVDRSIKIN